MRLLSNITNDVFCFFDRTFLAQLQLVNGGLHDAIDRLCPEYPLHRLTVLKFEITVNGECTINVAFRRIINAKDLGAAASQIIDLTRHAYVGRCDIGSFSSEEYLIRRVDWMHLTESLTRPRGSTCPPQLRPDIAGQYCAQPTS